MFIFCTAYDDTTKILRRFADTLMRHQPVNPEWVDLAREKELATIRDTLKRHPKVPFFFFGHGSATGLCKDGGGATIADQANPTPIAERITCATSCHSVAVLKDALPPTAAILGFSDVLYVPLTTGHADLMEPCVLTGPRKILRDESLRTAESASRAAFTQLAQDLSASPDFTDQLMGVFMALNADAVASHGNPDRRLSTA